MKSQNEVFDEAQEGTRRRTEAESTHARNNSRTRHLFAALALCTITLLAFSNSFSAGFVLDNKGLLLEDTAHPGSHLGQCRPDLSTHLLVASGRIRTLSPAHDPFLSFQLCGSGEWRPAGRISLDQFLPARRQRSSGLHSGAEAYSQILAFGFRRRAVGRASGAHRIRDQYDRTRGPAGRDGPAERIPDVSQEHGGGRVDIGSLGSPA